MLLVHYNAEKKLTSTFLMEPTSQGRSSANIGSTVAKHRSIAPQLLSAHALSGCDTVASCFGIGKTKVMKVLEAGNRLNHLGTPSANLEDVLCVSTAFVAAYYGQKCEALETTTDVRYKVWVSQTGRKGACLLPKLKAISPTLEAFKENIKRAHFQACIWKATPPTLEVFKENIKRAHFQACIWKATPPTLEAFKENIKRAHFQACIWKATPPTLEAFKVNIKRAHFQACIWKATPPTLEAFKVNIKRAHFQACIWKATPPTLEAFKENIKRAHFQACIWKATPPTLEAFKENIKRPHFQACIWEAALDEKPPNHDPLKFG